MLRTLHRPLRALAAHSVPPVLSLEVTGGPSVAQAPGRAYACFRAVLLEPGHAPRALRRPWMFLGYSGRAEP